MANTSHDLSYKGYDTDSESDEDDDEPKRNKCDKATWTRLTTPTKLPQDYNEYRLIRLKNGLKVLLIDSTFTRPNGAELDVDPEEDFKSGKTFGGRGRKIKNVAKKFMSPSLRLQPSENVKLKFTHPRSGLEKFLMKLEKPPPSNKDEAEASPQNNELLRYRRQYYWLPRCRVSMMVNAGSLDNPQNFAGCAHLLEHVVHLGSSSFPEEEGYRKTLKNLGGDYNAYTAAGETCYHFQVLQDGCFDGPQLLMKMLADFLANPLLSLDSINREIQSVDNEFFMRQTLFAVRYNSVLNRVGIEDKRHPMRQSSCGNKDLLMPANVPNASKKLQDALILFHRTYYCAQNMTLVVEASMPLDSLETIVANIFGNIPSNTSKGKQRTINDRNASSSQHTFPYKYEMFNRFVTLRPVEDTNSVILTWAFLPGTNYRTKPLEFISKLLEDASPNGLSSYLQTRNWIISTVTAGSFTNVGRRNKFAKHFYIYAELTDQGRKEIQMVLAAIFSYIRLIEEEGVTKERYSVLQQLETIRSKSFNSPNSLKWVKLLSGNMLDCKDEDILIGHERFFQFDGKLIQTYLRGMISSKANITLVTKKVGDVGFPELEPMHGARYLLEEISDELLEELENVEIYKEFELPDWKSFIPKPPNPTDCSAKSKRGSDQLWESQVLTSTPRHKLTLSPYNYFRSSVVGFVILLATPWNLTPCSDSGVCTLWKDIMSDELNGALQPWKQIRIQFQIGFLEKQSRMMIVVQGMNYRMTEALDTILRVISKFTLTEQRFQAYRDSMVNWYNNLSLDSSDLAVYLADRLLYSEYKTPLEMAQKLQQLTYCQFYQFVKLLYSCVRLEVIAFGNITTCQQARDIVMPLFEKNYFGFNPEKVIPTIKYVYNLQQLKREGRKIFPTGEKCLRVRGLNNESHISTILNHYDLDSSPWWGNYYIAKLIADSISPLLFTDLRTKQQLAYAVHSYLAYDSQGMRLYVMILPHADKFCPCDIDRRIDEFLERFYNSLKDSNECTDEFLRGCGIRQNREYVLDYVYKFITKSAKRNMSKVSIQVIGSSDRTRDDKVTPHCKASTWEGAGPSPIPKITLAREANGDDGQDKPEDGANLLGELSPNFYFISNLDDFYRSCTLP